MNGRTMAERGLLKFTGEYDFNGLGNAVCPMAVTANSASAAASSITSGGTQTSSWCFVFILYCCQSKTVLER